MGKRLSKAKKMTYEHEEEVHRVLGTKFTPPYPDHTDYVILGPGCFWGGEKIFWRLPGVYTTASGFAKDRKSDKPRAFVEAVLVVFDTSVISVSDITRMFFQCHDPTQVGGQGNDIGMEYRSAFFYHTEDQKRIAEAAIESYQNLIGEKVIATDVMKGSLDDFAFASDQHQQYLASPNANKYSSVKPKGIDMLPEGEWLPEDLKEDYLPKLDEKFWKKNAPFYQRVLKESNEQIKSW